MASLRLGAVIHALVIASCSATPPSRPIATTAPKPAIEPPPAIEPIAQGKRAAFLRSSFYRTVLFRDEEALVEDAARRTIEARAELGLAVITRRSVAAIEATIATGRLAPDGPVCAAPPAIEEAIDAAYPDAVPVELHAECKSRSVCEVEIRVWASPLVKKTSADAPVQSIVATFAPPGSVEGWERAIASARLRSYSPPPSPYASLASAYGLGSSYPAGWNLHEVVAGGPFAGELSDADFANEKSALATCADASTTHHELLLGIRDDGKVERCEGGGDCICRVFEAHRFDLATARRRLFLTIEKDSGSVGFGSSDGRIGTIGVGRAPARRARVDVQADPRSRARWDDPAFAACMQIERPAQHDMFGIRVDLDAIGRVVAAHLLGDEWLGDEERVCVLNAAMKLVFPCPAREPRTATAYLTVKR